MPKMPKIGPPLTWNDLADLYPGTARIRPMNEIFEWASSMTKKFYTHPKDKTIHLIIKEKKEKPE